MATVEKRGNSWCLIAYLGYEPSGKQIKKKKNIPADGISKIKAKRLANDFESELLEKKFINDKNMTLSQFVDFWKENFALIDDNYSPTTLERNETLLSRILPALGHIRISKLKPNHLLAFYNNLREDDMRLDGKKGKLSSRTVQMHHKLLSSILGKAKKWQMLEMNPCMYVDAPKSKSKKTPIWDEKTLIQFLELLYEHAKTKYLLFFLLAFSTGLRRGELLGLRKSTDISLEMAELRVNQNAIVVKTLGVQHKDPKTEKSASAVSFSPSIVPVFHQHFTEQDLLRRRYEEKGGVWPDNDLVFRTDEGKPMFPSTVSHWLTDFIEAHNLPKISTRSFRNMSITYAIDRGFDLKAVSERARHAQLSTTTDVYAHVLKPKDKAIAASLDKIIKQAKKVEIEFYGDFI